MGYEPGDEVSGFRLANANGEGMLSLDEIMSANGAVVVFECNHCPYVIGNISRIDKAANKAKQLGMGFVGINSNDADNYPDDSFENMQKRAVKGMPYPYLYDESQAVASAWGALRTPEFYLINSNGVVVYRGRLDDSPRNPNDATTSELDDAMDALSLGSQPTINRTESIGCSVKWKN
ncbi:MAG TPA: thioredoxin family protein [Candidatus Poseidoniales archaeon]|jgi:peroxiredoxin|nr:MAG: hypothetical protein CXT71_03855 [Euryarchaeota archaeon]HIF46231.1 thioredoxin family protein [Candidatus Poseidoniales archaeon]HIL65129.1 thioredoxin family protein [Candidatus Poseidoniales archaeon]